MKKLISEKPEHHLSIFFKEIYRRWRTIIDDQAKKFGLTRTEWNVLGLLSFYETGLTQAELTELIGIDAAQMTRVLGKLQQRKFLKKTQDRRDKRMKLLILQNTSTEFTHIINHVNNHIDQHLLAAFSKQEQELLLKFLTCIKYEMAAIHLS